MMSFSLRLLALSGFLSTLVVEGSLLRTGHADPKTVTKKCAPDFNVPYHSQYMEDEIIFNAFFGLVPKCDGVVVEMGGFDGKTFSNSWFFQYAVNWRALLVEAFPGNYEKMVVNRPDAINVFGAICPEDSVAFQPAISAATGGVLKDMSESHKQQFADGSAAVLDVPCMMLSELFQKNGIRHVDLFFLDVEGGELTVLETFDWSIRIDIFVVEMDARVPEKDEAVRQLLYKRGYVTPFSLLAECNHQTAECMPSEIFVMRDFADRNFADAVPL